MYKPTNLNLSSFCRRSVFGKRKASFANFTEDASVAIIKRAAVIYVAVIWAAVITKIFSAAIIIAKRANRQANCCRHLYACGKTFLGNCQWICDKCQNLRWPQGSERYWRSKGSLTKERSYYAHSCHEPTRHAGARAVYFALRINSR